MLTGKTLIIFDCDGVLFDSYEANIAYFNQCLTGAGHPPVPEDRAHRVAFLSVPQLIGELIPDHAEAARVLSLAKTIDYSPYLPRLRPLFDFERVLGTLGCRFTLALASNRGISLPRLFEHFGLGRYFAHCISILDARPKPDPDMLEQCLARTGANRREALFVGDAETDRESAARAGIDFLWVGRHEGEAWIGSVADLLLCDYSTAAVLKETSP